MMRRSLNLTGPHWFRRNIDMIGAMRCHRRSDCWIGFDRPLQPRTGVFGRSRIESRFQSQIANRRV